MSNQTDQRHEFVASTRNFPVTYCTFVKADAGYCGQRPEAECHVTSPFPDPVPTTTASSADVTLNRPDDHLYPHQQCKGCGEMFETTNQRLTHWCKGSQPVASQAPERSRLTRYDLKYIETSQGDLTDAFLEETEEGEFVKYADVVRSDLSAIALTDEQIQGVLMNPTNAAFLSTALAQHNKRFGIERAIEIVKAKRDEAQAKIHDPGPMGFMGYDNDEREYWSNVGKVRIYDELIAALKEGK